MQIKNKLESIEFINNNHLNKFPEKLFKKGEELLVQEFINMYDAKYYAIRDKSKSNGLFKLAVLKEDVLEEIKEYESYTINVSSINYKDNQLLVGEIMIKDNNEVWLTLSNDGPASVRDALKYPTYNYKTDLFNSRVLNKIDGFNEIYDYIIKHDLKNYIVEFALFDINVGIYNENIIIYEVRTDY